VNKKTGFTCGSFDLLHAGHSLMLKECKDHCNYLIVGLQRDPSVDRSDKNKPVQDYEERNIMLSSIRWVDEIIYYDTEDDLQELLQMLDIDIRIIGADWKGKKYTGWELNIPVVFNSRDHGYSTSRLRERVYNAEMIKREQ
tara:strand:- start:6 stop:428 length:423 start_codon:yes stop_codon:yes gene_type:complete